MERGLVVLVPSPLGSPDSWRAVVEELGYRGVEALISAPDLDEANPEPLWAQQATAVASAAEAAGQRYYFLVGHSGATGILPAVGERLAGRVDGYVFVDGPLPEDGRSPIEVMRTTMPGLAAAVERTLAAGRRFPDERAQRLSSEAAGETVAASPRGRRHFEEAIRVPTTWPDAPCAYIALSPDLGRSAAQARELGWTTRALDGNHFLMISAPELVAEVLLDTIDELVRLASFAGANRSAHAHS